MASAELGYKYNTDTTSNVGDWFSDTFLGTAKQQYKQNLSMLNEQNRFSEYMANTQYQRSVQDMVKAGINPMVAFAGGAGSAKVSAPSSAGASGGNIDKSGGIFGRATAKYINQMADNLSGKTAIDLAKAIL
nr:MAG: DNA pilot protein [Microvirus Sku126]